tara:strand:+ start:333 stop:1838 length:1506 start_codon:yes stop_codon:yes gene_type:complete
MAPGGDKRARAANAAMKRTDDDVAKLKRAAARGCERSKRELTSQAQWLSSEAFFAYFRWLVFSLRSAESGDNVQQPAEDLEHQRKAFKTFKEIAEGEYKFSTKDNWYTYGLAVFMRGKFLLEGVGVEKNYEEGLRWVHKAADELDWFDAQLYLADVYWDGVGPARDILKHQRYLEKAAGNKRGEDDGNELYKIRKALKSTAGTRIDWTRVRIDCEELNPYPLGSLRYDIARKGFAVLDTCLYGLFKVKRAQMRAIIDGYGIDDGFLGDGFLDAFVDCTDAPHHPVNPIHHLALCFLHGRCGAPRNLRIAKDLIKFLVDTYKQKYLGYDWQHDWPPGRQIEDDLKKLKSCAWCGGPGVKACQHCLVTLYCSKDCQRAHWLSERDDDSHKLTCPRKITPSCKLAFDDACPMVTLSVTPRDRRARASPKPAKEDDDEKVRIELDATEMKKKVAREIGQMASRMSGVPVTIDPNGDTFTVGQTEHPVDVEELVRDWKWLNRRRAA